MQKICGCCGNFTYIPCAMSGLSVSGFTSAIWITGWTLWKCAQGDMLSAAETLTSILKNKHSKFPATLNLLPKVINALWFNSHQVYHTYTKNRPPNLLFRWCNWTISKILTSFHHALMALGVGLSEVQWKIPTGNCKKNECSFCTVEG